MPDADTTKLMGTYRPPRVRVGDVATCLYRDADVVVTSVSAGRIPWPRCRRREGSGGSGLLVTETLVRAIKTESAAALMNSGWPTRPSGCGGRRSGWASGA